MPPVWFCLAAVVLLPVAVLPLAAQSASRLLAVSPPGGKAGTTLGVSVSGQDLDEPKELQFSTKGITSEHIGSNRFNVKIPANVPVGVYDVRVVGKNGVSNPRVFAVGTLEEINLDKASTEPGAAKDIPLNSTINARADANSVHYFRVNARKGQRVLVRCDARAIDSKIEPVLTALDEQGREIDRNRRGGLLDFTAPADDAFVIKVHDLIYRGGADWWYRLSVGTFAHVDFVFPSMVAPGKNKVSVFGRNLPDGKPAPDIFADGKPLEQIEIEIDVPAGESGRNTSGVALSPFQASAQFFAWRFDATTEPVLLSIASASVIAEREPNNSAREAQKISPPCDVAGQFPAGGDRDWFTFDAKKGDVFWVEVISHRLGLPTDPLVVVQRVSGDNASDVLELNDSDANLGGNEFDTRHRDPSGKLEIKEDGTYRILVRNLFGAARADARPAYHLSIRKPSPDFQLVALPQTPPPAKKDAKDILLTSLVTRRGESTPLKVLALRRDGFNGEIELSAVDLPAGITAPPCRIDSGKTSALMFLAASESAGGSHGAVQVRGSARDGESNITRAAKSASIVWGTADPANEAVVSRLTGSAVLSVLDDISPVRVRPHGSNALEVIAGGALKISLDIVRETNFTGTVKLKPLGLAALDSVPEMEIGAQDTNAVLQIDTAQQKLAAGTYAFTLQGTAQGKLEIGGKEKKSKDVTAMFYSMPVVFTVKAVQTAKQDAK